MKTPSLDMGNKPSSYLFGESLLMVEGMRANQQFFGLEVGT
jgi:hypothetical protein